MVRVISEKLFSPPRSRHSSGEAVDKELAARAVEALSGLNSRRLEFSDYESSSDSHWDSEVDFEGDCAENGTDDPTDSGCRPVGTEAVVRKRKERRRERNKVSAQAYRVRRREQGVKQQNVLVTLQDENSRLKKMVNSLESELDKVRRDVRQRLPGGASSSSPSSSSTVPSPFSPAPVHTKKSSAGDSKPQLLQSQSQSQLGAVPFCGGTLAAPKGFLTFGQLARADTLAPFNPPPPPPFSSAPSPSAQSQQTPRAVPVLVDNDRSHRQQVSPIVDNFSFSRPLPTTAPFSSSSSCSSSASSSPVAMTPASSTTTATTTAFPFPTSPARGSGLFTTTTPSSTHHLHHHNHHHTLGGLAFTKSSSTPLPTISERPVLQSGRFVHHHRQQQQNHQLLLHHSDLNANANANNTHTDNNAMVMAAAVNANANNSQAFCQNDNMNNMNNNNNVFNTMASAPLRAEAGGAVFKFTNA